jgi:transcriptional regulator GlxA family with amidase domain
MAHAASTGVDLRERTAGAQGDGRDGRVACTVEIQNMTASTSDCIAERALRRAFRSETGMSWREHRTTSRVLRAMTMLAQYDRSMLETATAVGFESLSESTVRSGTSPTEERPTDSRRRDPRRRRHR